MKVTFLRTTKHRGKWYTGGNHYVLPDPDAKAVIEDGRAVLFGEAPPAEDPNLVDFRTPEQIAKDSETTNTGEDESDLEEVEEEVEEEDPTTKETRKVKKKTKRKKSK